MAVNCLVVPSAALGLVGVTAIDTSDALVIVTMVLPDIVPKLAEIVADPIPEALANPFEPALLLTAVTAAFDEVQTTEAVRSWTVLSEYVPVAVNCLEVPSAKLGLVGVTEIETSTAGVTVISVVPDTDPKVAVIVAVPDVTGVASP